MKQEEKAQRKAKKYGEKRGEKNSKIEIAKKLLERNMTIKEIAEITKLTEEEIQKLNS